MWEVDYTKRFLKELSNLPSDAQGRVENPFSLGYLEKLKGHTDKNKIRVGATIELALALIQ